MCGIVGYVGPDEALPIVLEGLRRLEYRGYDSAGVAVLAEGLEVRKRSGKLAELEGRSTQSRRCGPCGDRAHPLGDARRARPTPTRTRRPIAPATSR